MKAIREHWNRWSKRFAALTLRERGIVAAAVVLGGGFLLFTFAVEPFQLKARAAAKSMAASQAEAQQLQAQLQVLKAQNTDPDAANRQRLDALRENLRGVGERIARFEEGMVPPSRMRDFLESLLARNRNIELLGLRTLPATPVGLPAAPAAPQAGASATGAPTPATAPATEDEGIYQHGVELRLAGSYHDLMHYLAELERMPQRLMWNSVALTAERYPRNVLVLRVYTLSLDKKWLVM